MRLFFAVLFLNKQNYTPDAANLRPSMLPVCPVIFIIARSRRLSMGNDMKKEGDFTLFLKTHTSEKVSLSAADTSGGTRASPRENW